MHTDLISHECPRCHVAVEQEYYGPCPKCRDELRDTIKGDPLDVETVDYEPKMNVTPNAVAQKD